MSESSTTSRSETTTKNETSSPFQKTSTTKAKLFKQTFPLSLSTTSEPPTQTSDTSLKQVLQQIIRAHIDEESQIDQSFRSSGNSLSQDDHSIPFRSQLAPPVFRSQFQAPIFDFFSKLAAHDDALESFPTTTTPSSMESDLPLINDREESSVALSKGAEKSIISSGQVSSGTIDIKEAKPASTVPTSTGREPSSISSISLIPLTTMVPKTSTVLRPDNGTTQQNEPLVLSNLEQVSNVTKPTSDIPAREIMKSISFFGGSSRIEQLIRQALEKLSPNTTKSDVTHRQPSQVFDLGTTPGSVTHQTVLNVNPNSSVTEVSDNNLQSSTASIISESTTHTKGSQLADRKPLIVTLFRNSSLDTEKRLLITSQSPSAPVKLTSYSPLEDITTSTISSSRKSGAAVGNRFGSGLLSTTLSTTPTNISPVPRANATIVTPAKNVTVSVGRYVGGTYQSLAVSSNSSGSSHFESHSSTAPGTTLPSGAVDRRHFQAAFRNASTKKSSKEKPPFGNNITAIFTNTSKIVAFVKEQLADTSRSSTVAINSSNFKNIITTTVLPKSTSTAALKVQSASFSQSSAVLQSSTVAYETSSTITTTASPPEELAANTDKYKGETSETSTIPTSSMDSSSSQSSWISTTPPTTGSVESLSKHFGNVLRSTTSTSIEPESFPFKSTIAEVDTATKNPATDAEKHFDDTSRGPSASTNSIGSSGLEFSTMTVLWSSTDGIVSKKVVGSTSQSSLSSELFMDNSQGGNTVQTIATTFANANADTEEESENFVANRTDLENRTETTTTHTLAMNPVRASTVGTEGVEANMPLRIGEHDVEERTLPKDTDAIKKVVTDSSVPSFNQGSLKTGEHDRKQDGKKSESHPLVEERTFPKSTDTVKKAKSDSSVLSLNRAPLKTGEHDRKQDEKKSESPPSVEERTLPKDADAAKKVKTDSSVLSLNREPERIPTTELHHSLLSSKDVLLSGHEGISIRKSLAKLHRAESPIRANHKPIRNKNVGITTEKRNRIEGKRRKVAAIHKSRNPKLILRRNSLMIPIRRGLSLPIPPNTKIAETIRTNRNVNRSNLDRLIDASQKSLQETGPKQSRDVKAGRVFSRETTISPDGPKRKFTLKLQNEIAQLTQAAVQQDGNELDSTQLSERVAALLRLLAASIEGAKESNKTHSESLQSSSEKPPTKDHTTPVKSKTRFSAAALP
ncbi:hypothetical protein TELCIR_14031 [Teladorsagia circumcincta]|uniref:Uncharacterized protein n=1 Tax=Teladorsagia circumcincta TaxID=45464 RepID=A0A2G9U277_TELCI|nr:hypothetical protein TELCIR_14031 [Teladorsagia circumcincta]